MEIFPCGESSRVVEGGDGVGWVWGGGSRVGKVGWGVRVGWVMLPPPEMCLQTNNKECDNSYGFGTIENHAKFRETKTSVASKSCPNSLTGSDKLIDLADQRAK